MNKPPFLTRKPVLGMIALALVAVAAGWYFVSDAAAPGAVTELDAPSFAQLRNDFNAAVGTTRVIVLLSPT